MRTRLAALRPKLLVTHSFGTVWAAHAAFDADTILLLAPPPCGFPTARGPAEYNGIRALRAAAAQLDPADFSTHRAEPCVHARSGRDAGFAGE